MVMSFVYVVMSKQYYGDVNLIRRDVHFIYGAVILIYADVVHVCGYVVLLL